MSKETFAVHFTFNDRNGSVGVLIVKPDGMSTFAAGSDFAQAAHLAQR